MRQTFDSSVSVVEQLIRSNAMRKVGRKHRHTLGPGNHKPKLHAQNVNKRNAKKARDYKDQVSEYWLGKRDTFPVRKG